jgi:hypothetical protein
LVKGGMGVVSNAAIGEGSRVESEGVDGRWRDVVREGVGGEGDAS